MKESNIQTMLSKKHEIYGVFELKLCKGKSIRFDAVKKHQSDALVAVKNNGFYHKISDFPMFAGSKTRFNRQKPFDFFYLKNTPAYVIICFYVPRIRKTCYYIDIEVWLTAELNSKKKSITEPEVKQIAKWVIDIK